MTTKTALPRAAAIAANLLLMAGTASAQVPETIHYQGHVTVGGEALEGTGQFKFAIVDDGTENVETATAVANVTSGFVTSFTVTDPGNGYVNPPMVSLSGGGGSGAAATAVIENGQVAEITVENTGSGYTSAPDVHVEPPPLASIITLWSNDGTSTAGEEPTAPVSLDVSGGVFSALLGDVSLAGMTPVPAAIFASSPVFLRIWFDGGSGFEQLTPDQPITSTPYSMMAASLAEGALQGSLATGARSNEASGTNTFVSGGLYNEENIASGEMSFVGGGSRNTASGRSSFVGGGFSDRASGYYSFVGGGHSNLASGGNSFVGGGAFNTASGLSSFAAGMNAKAMHDGTFVWADSTGLNFQSTAANQFLIRAHGGVGLNTGSPQRNLDIRQTTTDSSQIGLQIENTSSNNWAFYVAVSNNLGFRYNDTLQSRINATDGAYVQLSDARSKNSIEPLEKVLKKVLQLQPSSYFLNGASPEAGRSVGLIAQEVQHLFPELVSEQEGRYGINYSGLAVLNTAALIEMEAQHREQQNEIEALRASLANRDVMIADLAEAAERTNQEMEARLARIEKLLQGEELAAR